MRRVVFVTGSSRGIGFGIAKAFAANGDRIILNGRTDGERLARAAEELRGACPDVKYYLADLSDYDKCLECFDFLENETGLPEVLVNCAGVSHFGLFGEMKRDETELIIRQNLFTTLNCCRLAIPDMVKRKRGAIINISSVFGTAGASCEAVYSASKGAVNAFTKSLAKELGPSNVRVNAVACGAFETRMNERLTDEERNDFINSIPLSRFGGADEAGPLAVFLASEGASYLTGQIIALDGGLT